MNKQPCHTYVYIYAHEQDCLCFWAYSSIFLFLLQIVAGIIISPVDSSWWTIKDASRNIVLASLGYVLRIDLDLKCTHFPKIFFTAGGIYIGLEREAESGFNFSVIIKIATSRASAIEAMNWYAHPPMRRPTFCHSLYWWGPWSAFPWA